MKQFILHEATEQKKEIENKAEEEYHLEKQRIVGRERSKLTDQFEKMKDLTKVKAKIEDSKINNIQKLRVLEEKNAIIATVFQAAGQALQGAGNDSTTIQGLIRQGKRSFMDGTEIFIRCRAQDNALVSGACSAVGGCSMNNSAPITKSMACTFTTDCLGGIILHNKDSSIVVDQTFNARLNVCMERATPIVKPILFGEGGSKHLL